MTEQDIEKEVQARVDFKMNELITACTNIANTNFGAAFNSGHPKYTYYMDAFKEFKKMMVKEKNLPLPYDMMHEQNRRDYRDKIVERLEKRLLKRGTQSYQQDLKVLVEAIKEAQKFEHIYEYLPNLSYSPKDKLTDGKPFTF